MSAVPGLSRSPPLARAAPSPRSPLLHGFEDPPKNSPAEHPHPDEPEDDDEIPYPEPSSEQTLLPPPNFKPFFTLVEDTTTGEHYHPYVHYVFVDDDPAIITAASMRGLGLDDTKYMPHGTYNDSESQPDHERVSEDGSDPPIESPLPPPIPGVREHYLIIDLGADGRTIVDAQSLSPDWQITDKDIRTAPSFDESSPDQGYMLRIEGTEIPGKQKGKGKGQVGDDKFHEARERSQGDVFLALDGLVLSIDGGLDIAARLTQASTGDAQDTETNVQCTRDEAGLTAET